MQTARRECRCVFCTAPIEEAKWYFALFCIGDLKKETEREITSITSAPPKDKQGQRIKMHTPKIIDPLAW